MNTILQYRAGIKQTYVSKIGKINYFVTTRYSGEENIIDKLGKIIVNDYEKAEPKQLSK